MKALLTARLLSALILCWLTSIVSASAENSGEGDVIAAIRKRYATINQNLSKYKQVKKELAGFSTEGGELTAYFEGDAIRKIAAKYYGETGRAFEEYYYWDGELQFVYRKSDTYSEPMSGKVVKTQETRFYFKEDQLIRSLDEKGKRVKRDNSEFAEHQTEYTSNSAIFTAGARSEKTTIEKPD